MLAKYAVLIDEYPEGFFRVGVSEANRCDIAQTKAAIFTVAEHQVLNYSLLENRKQSGCMEKQM